MNGSGQASSAPRGAVDDTPVQASNGHTRVPWWVSLRAGLQLASQLVIASPIRLPAKVVVAAKYMSLALGLWDSLDGRPEPPAASTEEASDAP